MQDLTFHLAMTGIFGVLAAGLFASWRWLRSYPDASDFTGRSTLDPGRMAHAISAVEEKRRKRLHAARVRRARAKKRAA